MFGIHDARVCKKKLLGILKIKSLILQLCSKKCCLKDLNIPKRQTKRTLSKFINLRMFTCIWPAYMQFRCKQPECYIFEGLIELRGKCWTLFDSRGLFCWKVCVPNSGSWGCVGVLYYEKGFHIVQSWQMLSFFFWPSMVDPVEHSEANAEKHRALQHVVAGSRSALIWCSSCLVKIHMESDKDPISTGQLLCIRTEQETATG